MPETSTISIGPHRTWIELPDIFVTHWQGSVEANDIHAMYDAVERFSASCPYIYALNIVKDASMMSRTGREAATRDPRSKLLRAMAIVGASFHIRIVSTMLVKASSLLGSPNEMPVAFFATADEGHQWFAQLRRERAR